jgi:hypothetical protein
MSSQRSATSSEAVAVSDQDSGGVPMPRAVLLGGLDDALDLPVGEIFTAALANCYRLEPLCEAASFPWKQPSRLLVLLQIYEEV